MSDGRICRDFRLFACFSRRFSPVVTYGILQDAGPALSGCASRDVGMRTPMQRGERPEKRRRARKCVLPKPKTPASARKRGQRQALAGKNHRQSTCTPSGRRFGVVFRQRSADEYYLQIWSYRYRRFLFFPMQIYNIRGLLSSPRYRKADGAMREKSVKVRPKWRAVKKVF